MPDNEIIQEARTKLLTAATADTSAMQDEVQRTQKQSLLRAGIEQAASLVTSNDSTKQEITHYATAGVKTAALFFGGRIGLASTVGLYAADEINPRETATNMLIDGTLGAAKGGAMRGLFHLAGEMKWNPAGQALALGIGSRFTDQMFQRSWDFMDVRKVVANSIDKHQIGTDLATFGLSYGVFKDMDRMAGQALSKSRIGSTAFLGGSFGLVSGSHEEMTRQLRSGEALDYGKVAWRGLAMGAVDAVAAVPGGVRAAIKAPMELTDAQVTKLRDVTKQNGLWMLEMPKVVRAADGTPIIMPLRGTLQNAADAISRVATEVNHPVTLDWNSVQFKVKPGMTPRDVEIAYESAANDPRRLAAVKKEELRQEVERTRQENKATRDVDAMRGRPALEPEVLMSKLHRHAAERGMDWTIYAISSLKHPTEILEFARGYVRFDPANALANLRDAGRFAKMGTQEAWNRAADQVAREGGGAAGTKEDALFSQIREYDSLRMSAKQQDLTMRVTNEQGIIVEPNGPVNIREAGASAGKFAGQINKNVKLRFNEKFVEVKPFATGVEVENVWRNTAR